ncbi:MAG: hypothetical protein WEC75_04350 [Dehalococcoidia bacterium]
MMVRLDFTGGAGGRARALRVSPRRESGVTLMADAGPHLPLRDACVDELFVGRTISARRDIAETLDELWRVCKPGALIHLTLPHASSTIAASRDPHGAPALTLDTFNYYDPRLRSADGQRPTAFTVERARLRLAGRRDGDAGLALARGPLATVIEKVANGSRGSQYRFERWFAQLFGGFEEFSVVLSVVKAPSRSSSGDRPARREPAGMSGA